MFLMKPVNKWPSVKSFLLLFFVKVIAPQSSVSGEQMTKNAEATEPTEGENNEISQVVQVITQANKKNGVAVT